MSVRKDFEEFCHRTRPPMSTIRQQFGTGPYSWTTTQAAWRAWQYLDKQNNQKTKACKSVSP